MPPETWSPIRWADKFLRADAEQPVGTARLLLSEIRWNQWVLLQWRLSQDSRFYPFKQKELLPKLIDANPEVSVVEALHLQRETSSQTILDRNIQISASLTANPQEPWLNRKVLLDSEGNPLAIGVPVVPRQRREVRREIGRGAMYDIMGRTRAEDLPEGDHKSRGLGFRAHGAHKNRGFRPQKNSSAK